MLIFANVLDNLRLVTQFRIILQAFYQFIIINKDYPNEIIEIVLGMLELKFGHRKLQSMWNVAIFLFITFDQIDTTLDFSMNVVIVGRV